MQVGQYLIEAGADPSIPSKTGVTCLHVAAQGGSLDLVRTLLDRGTPVDARDELDQATPLFYAVMNQKLDIVKLLLARGADAHARASAASITLVHAACITGGTDILKHLVETVKLDIRAVTGKGLQAHELPHCDLACRNYILRQLDSEFFAAADAPSPHGSRNRSQREKDAGGTVQPMCCVIM